jgi:hypothetical protein
MHDDRWVMTDENIVEPSFISDVSYLERTPLDGLSMAINKIVDDDRLMAGVLKRFTCMAANIACPSDN